LAGSMDTGASGRLRAALLLLAIASAGAAAGTLKVAACETYWPYVGVSEGAQLTGFDVEFWELLYPGSPPPARELAAPPASAPFCPCGRQFPARIPPLSDIGCPRHRSIVQK
jgi:hypothetical protein